MPVAGKFSDDDGERFLFEAIIIEYSVQNTLGNRWPWIVLQHGERICNVTSRYLGLNRHLRNDDK
jgi:hypothetical protein